MENKLDLCQQCSPAATTPTSHGIALASGQQVQGCGYSLLPGSGEAASAILRAVFKHTPHCMGDAGILERLQHSPRISQEEHVPREEMQWELGWFSLQSHRCKGQG